MRKEPATFSYHFTARALLRLMKPVFLVLILCATVCFQTKTANAILPVTGVEVQELAVFDAAMQSFMGTHGLQAGILGISKDGCIVYQRGFGYAFNQTDPLPENTIMRLASVEKPHTAAVIRYLVADGILAFTDFVFDMEQESPAGERRLLDARFPSSEYYPYDGDYGDARLADIRVGDLMNHEGGWDRGLKFCPFDHSKMLEIGYAVGSYPESPPSREEIVRYMMSDSLQFDPGNLPPRCDFNFEDKCTGAIVGTDSLCYCDNYSNYGYMLLSLIIEQETGQQHTDAINQRVYIPEMWVPSTEIIFGEALRPDQSPREPLYLSSGLCTSLYILNLVCYCPYGSMVMEVKTGEGNLVGSAAPLLTFLDHYSVPRGAVISSAETGSKNGALPGTSTMIRQREDGFNVVVLFNQRVADMDAAGEVASETYTLIDTTPGIDWESLKCIDGFWIDFNRRGSGFGGHDDPFHLMSIALGAITDDTKLRIKPGASNWTGTITTRTLIDAPFGTVVIGQ
ncbi:MAG: beta-lactamase family protein [Gemmatimonadales bacterium]|nr:beta-lactamase family protein [Gemmatimonadales bacterium]